MTIRDVIRFTGLFLSFATTAGFAAGLRGLPMPQADSAFVPALLITVLMAVREKRA